MGNTKSFAELREKGLIIVGGPDRCIRATIGTMGGRSDIGYFQLWRDAALTCFTVDGAIREGSGSGP